MRTENKPSPGAPYGWEGSKEEWDKEEVPRKVTDGKWRMEPFFQCRGCKEVAYLHPFTNRIWGCKKCKYTTASVSVFFEELPRESGMSEQTEGQEWSAKIARYSLSPNVMVVARTRIEGTWAAYVAAVPGQSLSEDEKLTLDNGTKLSEKIARAIFSTFEEMKYIS